MPRTKTRHEPTYQHVKGKVVVACTCGRVRRYADKTQARAAHGDHVLAQIRPRRTREES